MRSGATLFGTGGRICDSDPLLVDGVLAAALALASAVQFAVWPGVQVFPGGAEPAWKLLLIVPGTLAVAVRRRWPFWSFLIQGAFAGFAAEPPMLGQYAAMLVTAYSMGASPGRRWPQLVALVAGLLALQIAVPTARPPVPPQWQNLVVATGVWMVGAAIRNWQERSRSLERERAAVAQVAAAAERARIARELHDVVAHGVSLMVVQAGAARRSLEQRPADAAEAIRTVEAGGREALAELRRLLGVLRDEGEAVVPLVPQPGLDDLPAMVDRFAAAGLPVRADVVGERLRLPSDLDLTAYRIVQEALTNALRHSGAAPTSVIVAFGDGDLRIEVLDEGTGGPGSVAGAGRGLVGMRERVAAFGGELEVGPRAEGGFAVRARLPVDRP